MIASPFIPFLFLLIYIQVTLEAPVPPSTKPGQFRGSKITVKHNTLYKDRGDCDKALELYKGSLRVMRELINQLAILLYCTT